MKVNDFLKMLRHAAEVKTLYVMGGWGFPLNGENKERTQKNDFNRREDRKSKIFSASSDVFAFDCCGLVKSILWGWYGNKDLRNGGAVYASNGVPDYDAKELMFKGCTIQSKDFSEIVPGSLLWLDGHCGVYLGDGLAIESTTKWSDGVQITAVANIGEKAGYNSRTWTYHGRLKYVDYSEPVPSKYPITPFKAVNTLKGVAVRDIPYSDGNIIATIKQGATITVESLEGSSGDFAKITGYVYLPGGFDWEGKK